MPIITPYIFKPIEFLPADPAVAEAAEALQLLIVDLDPNVFVEHIGSTAVPGMPGKNSINLLLLIESKRFADFLNNLESIGFHADPIIIEPAHRPRRIGTFAHGGKDHSIHVHLTEPESDDHQNAVFFRQYLTDHPELQKEYAEVKRMAAKNAAEDPLAYNRAKHAFIQRILHLRATDTGL